MSDDLKRSAHVVSGGTNYGLRSIEIPEEMVRPLGSPFNRGPSVYPTRKRRRAVIILKQSTTG